jgi:serine/threonine protein kinase
VYLAIHKSTKKENAIKVINKKDLGKDYEKNLKMEVDILKKVNHPNIIALKELFDTPDKLYLVMELYVFFIKLCFLVCERFSWKERKRKEIIIML